jgi:hypothetical protein
MLEIPVRASKFQQVASSMLLACTGLIPIHDAMPRIVYCYYCTPALPWSLGLEPAEDHGERCHSVVGCGVFNLQSPTFSVFRVLRLGSVKVLIPDPETFVPAVGQVAWSQGVGWLSLSSLAGRVILSMSWMMLGYAAGWSRVGCWESG